MLLEGTPVQRRCWSGDECIDRADQAGFLVLSTLSALIQRMEKKQKSYP